MPASLGLGSPYKTQSSRGSSLMSPTQPNHHWLTKAFHAFLQEEYLGFRMAQDFQGQVEPAWPFFTHSTKQHIEAHQAFSHRLPGRLQPSTQGHRDLAAHVAFEGPILLAWR